MTRLAEPGPGREAAARDLLELLARLAATPLRGGLIIDFSERDEIVQRVLFKTMDRGVALRLVGKSDGECVAYFQAMLFSAWIDELRSRRRERPPAAAEPPPEMAAPPPEQPVPLEAARVLLDRAFAHLREQRLPRYRLELDRAWKQVQELVFQGVAMAEILARDEDVDTASEARLVKQARDRLLQNHKRLRDGLRGAVDELSVEGRLDAEQAHLARAALRMLLRCQRTPSMPSVSQDKP